MANNSKIILGIDPGTIIMGYGLIAVTGQQAEIIKMDVLKLNPKKTITKGFAPSTTV